MGERHPIPGVGVGVVADGKVLLVQKNRGPFRGLWGVPGGKVRLGETRLAAAEREVAEETGLAVEVGRPIWIGEAIGPGDPPQWHFTLVDFVAEVRGGDLLAGDDAGAVGWFTLHEMRSLPLIPMMEELIEPLEQFT